MVLEYEPKITKKYLLERQTQETYLEYYLGIPVKKGLFKSPLRNDNSPTCSFYRNASGDIIFNDFSGQFYGNFISVVMYKYSCTYYKALQIIANDFGYITHKTLPKNNKPVIASKSEFKDDGPAIIRADVQEFTESELQWWAQYGIAKEILKRFRVYSCKAIYLNGSYYATTGPQNPMFGYYRGKNDKGVELWRIYFPFRERGTTRFLSNWKSIMLQGAHQLPAEGDLLVVTKSMKDVMCLYSLGITAIAPNSENLFLTESQFEKLSKRFKKIVVFYDNDLPGIHNMNQIRKKFNIDCIFIPRSYGAKDISDFHAKYGREKTLNLIEEAWRTLKK